MQFRRVGQQGPTRTLTAALKRVIKQLLGTRSRTQVNYYKQENRLCTLCTLRFLLAFYQLLSLYSSYVYNQVNIAANKPTVFVCQMLSIVVRRLSDVFLLKRNFYYLVTVGRRKYVVGCCIHRISSIKSH